MSKSGVPVKSPSKAKLVVTDDLSSTMPAVKMTCSCKWEEKAYLRDAVSRGTHHLRVKHSGGTMVYKDWVRVITPHSKKVYSKLFNHGKGE